MIYLSIPYTGMEKLSFEISCLITAFLMKTGRTVFSPIVLGHTVASRCNLPKDCDFWLKHDLEALKCCSEMYVVMLKGWENSVGVRRELEEARRLGIPVTFIEPGRFISDEQEEPYEIR